MLKVVVLCKFHTSTRDWGGVATHNKYLIRSLEKYSRQKFVIHVLSFGERDGYIKIGNVSVILVKSRWYYYVFPFLALLRVMREVLTIRPSVIHVQGINVSPYSLSMIFPFPNCKKVMTIHGFSSAEAIAFGKLKRTSLRFWVMRLWEKFMIKMSDSIITVSSGVKNYIATELNECNAKVTVIYNGVDVDEFTPLVKGEIMRKQHGIKRNDFVLIFAKDLISKNGPEILVKAMPYILKKYRNVHLIMAGDGPKKHELMKIAKDLDVLKNTIFTGRIPHERIKYYLAASDVIVIPSVSVSGYEEGRHRIEDACPNLMLEGMAMGKPVIASAIGGMKEVINEHGTGILIPDRDSQAIAEVVLHLIEDPKYGEIIGERARKYVTKHMTWSEVAEKTVEVYEKLR